MSDRATQLDECAWLIERHTEDGGVEWWDGNAGTTDSLQAVRFARKLDVETLLNRRRLDFWKLGCYPAEHMWLGSARPPVPPQEISPEMVERFRRALKPCDVACDAHIVQALEAALRVRGEPAPPEAPEYVVAGQCLSTQHNQEPCDCAPRVKGEPAREPTLEEIVRTTLAIRQTWPIRLPPMDQMENESMDDYEVRCYSVAVRARLSSPEAPHV